MALVSLIADLEGWIAAEFGMEVVLVYETAMSSCRSPRASIATLNSHGSPAFPRQNFVG
jgi:hypothetical protein